jgi:arylsulfatase
MTLKHLTAAGAAGLAACLAAAPAAQAQDKPNILLIVSDDTGYGDLGPYGGGEGRGMPTPSIDALAAEGKTFFSFYAQPSCTPGRAAMQTGRFPNRSGMTTVAFQGQGGGLPAAEWTLASVLKQGGYETYFTGKWHLGEADYALPNAQGYDEMKYVGLYHLNAYTYGDPTWFPAMPAELRDMFQKVTKGALSGKAGGPVTEDFKINGQYVDTPVIDGKVVLVGGDLQIGQDSKDPNAPKEYYLAQVEVTPEGQKKLSGLRVQPGMPVDVIIKTGERTFMSYFLKPLLDKLARSFKD